jgi:hypothetical protein
MTSPLEQKIKITGPIVVTANRVGDGVVVYRSTGGGWTTKLQEAAVTADAEVAREMVRGAIADDLGAVGAYIAPVAVSRDGGIRPGNLREQIRFAGPTIELPITARTPAQIQKPDAHVSVR